MTIDLTETTTGAIASALQQARQRLGGPASGMVLTLVIVTDETSQYDAVRAANEAAREHPCRVLVVITRRPTAASRLDAEIRVGETSPGETLLLRMYGPLGQHADSVVAPLLLPDTPVVTWWPGDPPAVPAGDPIGVLSQRRITDAAAVDEPRECLTALAAGYQPGDTDLSWTRATPWRSLLAATLDQPHGTIQSATVRGRAGEPERRPDRRLAGLPAADPGGQRGLVRPRHHRGQLRHQRGRDQRDPARRPGGAAEPSRPARAPGGAAPARRTGTARRRSCAGWTRTRCTPNP